MTTLPASHLRPIREATILTGVPARTIARWAAADLIEAVRFGRPWYVNLDDITNLKNTLKSGPKPKKQISPTL